MSTFFAGNSKLILIKKQADAATPADLNSGALAFRIYEWSKTPVRTQGPLDETDASIQQSGSHVTAITPGFSFGMYGRASELDLIAEALLGLDDDQASGGPIIHTATPDQEQPYYTIGEVDPYAYTVYDGCKLVAGTFTAQDTGQTELRVTGLQWDALGYTAGGTAPDPLPTPVDELPFIYAECAVSYDDVHPGTTNEFSVTVNRNAIRAQGDTGFRGLAVIAGKFQVDGQFTRYVANDEILRAVDTGSKTGTDPTAVLYTESMQILFDRPVDDLQFQIASQEIAYETRQAAIDPSAGTPYKEVLGFRTQPQAALEDNITIVTVNAKSTPDG